MQNWLVTFNIPKYFNGTLGPRWLFHLTDFRVGVLTTRFAATMVAIFGVAISFRVTAATVRGPAALHQLRWSLRRRALFLYLLGFFFGWAWPGEILHFYGLFALVASFICTWRNWQLLILGLVVVGAAAMIQLARFRALNQGLSLWWPWTTRPDLGRPHGLVADWFVSGTHVLTPWLAFLAIGLLVGRHDLRLRRVRRAMATAGVALLAVGYTASSVGTRKFHDRWRFAFRTSQLSRMPLYVVTTIGSTLAALALIVTLAERWRERRVVQAVARAGRVTLTFYLIHGLIAAAYVKYIGHGRVSFGLTGAFCAVVAYWLMAMVLGNWMERRFGGGPAELIERPLCS